MWIQTQIKGCFVVEAPIHADSRGWLTKPIDKHSSDQLWGELNGIGEVFWSESKPGVFRGLHLQLPPHAVDKTVFCISGEIIDYVVDLRTDSETYLETLSIKLGTSPEDKRGVFIPFGCAHGFYVPEVTSMVLYLQSGPRNETAESGLTAQHLVQKGVLPIEVVMSIRDELLPNLSEFPRLTQKMWSQSE
jgi:dTDP-4-dehydrorhamnose 3,5-epimerase-like enzyme